MEGGSYLGLFCIRDKSCIDTLPVRNESGMWQAWGMEEGGRYMVQPLDWCREPWGEVRIVSRELFVTHLMPLAETPADNTAEECDQRRHIRSDSPELLAQWYEESRRSAMRDERRTQHFAPPRHSDLTERPPQAPVDRSEPVLLPAWHPDLFLGEEFFDEREAQLAASIQMPSRSMSHLLAEEPGDGPLLFAEADVPLAAPPQPAYVPSGPAVTTSHASTSPAPPPVASAAAARPAPPVISTPAAKPAVSDAEKLEQTAMAEESAMRAAFERLIEQVGAVPSREQERELARLVMSGDALTWKQKFMFTDFGLALRRKRLPRLALACHKRALAFAPNDEHILFNVARMEYELDNIEAAKDHLYQALAVAPDFAVARSFLQFLEGGRGRGQSVASAET